ncbi:hypothetical protein [Paludisphaera mucosa]|uniref:Uncharacterized protein n=1 Tax=Paludisphaera mucosa TaxID=3030827 RepID=A0ABT6F4Q9_9BACT|nr:hypothetical protein [Paludisphaera mucosa]MDG3002428.1 hypothetical protein [Paludisphaera mucosa]
MRDESFSELDEYQSNAPADLSFAFPAAGSCRSGPAVAATPGAACVARGAAASSGRSPTRDSTRREASAGSPAG